MKMCHQYKDNLSINVELSQCIESLTWDQSKSPLWLDWHNGCITSSQFGEASDGLPEVVSMPCQVRWGIENYCHNATAVQVAVQKQV